MQDILFSIPLPPVTKKNSQRLVKRGEQTIPLPSEAFEKYEASAGWFLPHRGENISAPCEVTAMFYMSTRRIVDLVNLLEGLDDILVTYKVLKDDNSRIIVSHDGSRVLYDKEHPRTDVLIRFL